MNSSPAPICVLLVEDHPLVRWALASLLAQHNRFLVVGQTDNGEQAVLLAAKLKPDLVLMDIDLRGIDGVTATSRIKQFWPAIRVLALTAFAEESHVVAMLAAGADGYCTKWIEGRQLISAMEVLHRGGVYLDAEVAGKLASLVKPAGESPAAAAAPSLPPLPKLTAAEQKILRLLATGHSNKDIADKLRLPHGTVKFHVRSILTKLGADNRTTAAVRALQEGLTENLPLSD